MHNKKKTLSVQIDNAAYDAFKKLSAELGYPETTTMLHKALALLFVDCGHQVPETMRVRLSCFPDGKESLEAKARYYEVAGEEVPRAVAYKLSRLKTADCGDHTPTRQIAVEAGRPISVRRHKA